MNNISNEAGSSGISHNISVDFHHDEEVLRRLETVVPFLVPVIFSIIILIGGVGNILVVLVVIINKNMRNTTNLLILNLAVNFICRVGQLVRIGSPSTKAFQQAKQFRKLK